MIPFLSKHCHISVPHHGKIRGIQNVQCTYKTYIRLKFVLLGEIFGCGLEKPRNFVVTSQRTNQSPPCPCLPSFFPSGGGGMTSFIIYVPSISSPTPADNYAILPLPPLKLMIYRVLYPPPHPHLHLMYTSLPLCSL